MWILRRNLSALRLDIAERILKSGLEWVCVQGMDNDWNPKYCIYYCTCFNIISMYTYNMNACARIFSGFFFYESET